MPIPKLRWHASWYTRCEVYTCSFYAGILYRSSKSRANVFHSRPLAAHGVIGIVWLFFLLLRNGNQGDVIILQNMLHWLTMNILNIRACRVKVNICYQTKLVYFYRINAVCFSLKSSSQSWAKLFFFDFPVCQNGQPSLIVIGIDGRWKRIIRRK